MAIKTTTNKRPFKNCKMLKMWKMTDEVNETYAASPTLDFTNRLTTYTDSQTTNSTPLYGDGEHLEDAVAIGEGSLSLGVHHVADEERVDMYGEGTNGSGAAISTGKEIPPYFCVALAAEKRNGMLNLRKYFKTMFQPHEENVTQQESGGITYSMPTLNGTYSKNSRLGMRAVRVEVDPNTADGYEFIQNWYANAEYIGGSGLVNACTLKKGTTVLNNGDSIAEGELTFTGSATGGTTPYKYSFYYRAAGSDSWTTAQEDSTTASTTATIDVATDADYEFKLVVKDANGVTMTKTMTVTITASA